MKTLEFQFVLKAMTPISHHQGTDGNVGVLHCEHIAMPDGSARDIPDVSGNAMRHGIRKAVTDLILDTLGLLKRGSFDHPDMVRFLYNGGAGGQDGPVKLDEMRAMQQLVPSVTLLGGTGRGQFLESILEVDPALLICAESEHTLQAWQREELSGVELQPSVAYETLREEYRHDEAVKPQGRFLLTDAALALVNDRAARRERAGEADDEAAIAESKGGMMPHSAEEVIRGSLWSWSVVAHVGSELEELTARAALSAFLRRPVVGGGKRVARGRFAVHSSRGFDHLRPADALRVMTIRDLAGPEHEAPFIEHVLQRADEARAWLGVK